MSARFQVDASNSKASLAMGRPSSTPPDSPFRVSSVDVSHLIASPCEKPGQLDGVDVSAAGRRPVEEKTQDHNLRRPAVRNWQARLRGIRTARESRASPKAIIARVLELRRTLRHDFKLRLHEVAVQSGGETAAVEIQCGLPAFGAPPRIGPQAPPARPDHWRSELGAGHPRISFRARRECGVPAFAGLAPQSGRPDHRREGDRTRRCLSPSSEPMPCDPMSPLELPRLRRSSRAGGSRTRINRDQADRAGL